MVNRITVTLEQPEYSALLEMALAELRSPPDQLHHVLREELKRWGLLKQPDELQDEDVQPVKQRPSEYRAGVHVDLQHTTTDERTME